MQWWCPGQISKMRQGWKSNHIGIIFICFEPYGLNSTKLLQYMEISNFCKNRPKIRVPQGAKLRSNDPSEVPCSPKKYKSEKLSRFSVWYSNNLVTNLTKVSGAFSKSNHQTEATMTQWSQWALYKTWSFPLRISSVNVTKSAENCGFGHIYW